MQKIKKLFGLFSKTRQEEKNPLTVGSLKNKNFHESIDIKFVAGVPLLDVEIEGESYRFMFDTGAFTVIPTKVIQKHALELVKTGINSVDASGEESLLRLHKLPSLKIGRLNFEDFSVASDDFSEKFPLSCLKFDGILGYNFLQNLIVHINYEQKKIILSDSLKKTSDYSKMKLSFDVLSGPKILFDFGFKSSLVSIDSGKNDGFILGESSYKKSFLEQGFTSQTIKGIVQSSYNSEDKSSLRERFLVKNFTIEKKITIVSFPIEVESGGQNLLGNNFLKLFNIILDLKQKNAYFKALNPLKIDLKESFGFYTFWSQEKKLFISAIVDDSLADKASLKIGDRILAINELDTLNFRQEDYCQLFLSFYEEKKTYESQKSVALVIQRDRLIKKVLLKKLE